MIYPFVITLREALEAAIIVAIVFAYLTRVGRADLKKYAWWGTISAIVLSLISGSIVIAVFGGLSGIGEKLFEGIAAYTAVAVLTYIIFWMARNASKIKGKLEQKIRIAITTRYLLGIAIVTFIAVFREGLETVLFLTNSMVSDPSGTTAGIVTGLGVVLVIVFLILRGSRQLPTRKFFTVTSIVLLIFAAGILSYGTHELIEAAEDSGSDLGWLGGRAYDLNPPMNPDNSYPLFHEKGSVGMIIRSLVGTIYLDPEWLTLFAYLGYGLVVGTLIFKVYAPTKFNGLIDRVFWFRRSKRKRQ